MFLGVLVFLPITLDLVVAAHMPNLVKVLFPSLARLLLVFLAAVMTYIDMGLPTSSSGSASVMSIVFGVVGVVGGESDDVMFPFSTTSYIIVLVVVVNVFVVVVVVMVVDVNDDINVCMCSYYAFIHMCK